MEGSMRFNERSTDRKLPDPENMNWEALSSILRQAEEAHQKLQAAHEGLIAATKEENWRTATPEQMQTSDAALANEQQAFEAYATAAAKRNEALVKMDRYLQEAHKAYRMSTEQEQVLLEKRQRFQAGLVNPDGTVSFESMRAIADIDAQLPIVEATCDEAYARLQKVLATYDDTLTGRIEADEAIAAK